MLQGAEGERRKRVRGRCRLGAACHEGSVTYHEVRSKWQGRYILYAMKTIRQPFRLCLRSGRFPFVNELWAGIDTPGAVAFDNLGFRS